MLSPLLVEYDSNIKALKEQVKTYKARNLYYNTIIYNYL